MNSLNNTIDEVVECPLCMEPFEVDDLNFYPCTCGYQICRFCWHRIRTDENELCPACRKEYPENPADFTPLTHEEMIAFKSQKRQRDQQRKHKITENRKHLANVRVVQKNLVFVVGLPPRLADADILKKHEYFGKYGKIHKVVINPSTTYAGVQGPSASAYVTYVNNSDALRAIQSVNNIMIDGRQIKTSLGTTKYCSHFMKNQQCTKSDCMYLHELGDPEASFTKEEMHQGKHQEYEKRLHEVLIANSGVILACGVNQVSMNGTGLPAVTANATSNCKSAGGSTTSLSVGSTSMSVKLSSVITTDTQQQKEVWPSLNVSPISNKEGIIMNKNKKQKTKNEKLKTDCNAKSKRAESNTSSSSSNIMNKDQSHRNTIKESVLDGVMVTGFVPLEQKNTGNKTKLDKNKDKNHHGKLFRNRKELKDQQSFLNVKCVVTADEEGTDQHSHIRVTYQNNHNNLASDCQDEERVLKNEEVRSLSTTSSSSSNSSSNSDCISMFSESESGKSSPGSASESNRIEANGGNLNCLFDTSDANPALDLNVQPIVADSWNKDDENSIIIKNSGTFFNSKNITNGSDKSNNTLSTIPSTTSTLLSPCSSTNDIGTTMFSKLNIFDGNSFFSSTSTTSCPQSLLKTNLEDQNHINSASHLPDLLKGINGYADTKHTKSANEWEEILNVMMRNTNQGPTMEELQQEQFHQHQPLPHDKLLYIQELHKRRDSSNMLNSFRDHNIYPAANRQHQPLIQSTQPAGHGVDNPLFAMNMSTFFDFHKNQQEQINQQFLLSGNTVNSHLNDNMHISAFFGNNCMNSKDFAQSSGPVMASPPQISKQRYLGKREPLLLPQTQNHQRHGNRQHNQPQLQSHRISNQFVQNLSTDDDLGFDPFIETQKALAELMETEVMQHHDTHKDNSTSLEDTKNIHHQQQPFSQQQLLDNMQRARMPPPGFNHMNSFGFGVPRSQNSSNILPFMNTSCNGTVTYSQSSQQMPNTWNPQLVTLQQQQQSDSQISQNHSSGNYNKIYNNNDWTAMDPAILSFRQFSAFPQQQRSHNSQQDSFGQHVHNSQGFGPQFPLSGINLSNNTLNLQQSSQPHVDVQGILEYLKSRQST